MSENEKPEDESERRRKVIEEKILGGVIEIIERARKEPVARSIALRLFFLLENIRQFGEVVKAMGKTTDPLTEKAPPFTKDQTNFLIRTYNSVINDLRSHLERKDSYLREFFPFEELDDPSINAVAKILFMMGTNILQLISYMLRWIE